MEKGGLCGRGVPMLRAGGRVRLVLWPTTRSFTQSTAGPAGFRDIIEVRRAALKRNPRPTGGEDDKTGRMGAKVGRLQKVERSTDDLIAFAKQSALVAGQEREQKLKERNRSPHSAQMDKQLDAFLRQQETKKDIDWLNLLGTMKRKKCRTHMLKLFTALQGHPTLFQGDIKKKSWLLMLKLHAEHGDSQKAYELYRSIREDPEEQVLVKHSLLLLEAVCKTGQLNTILEVASAVPKEHQKASFFEVLLTALKAQGDYAAMEQMLLKMESCSVSLRVKDVAWTLHEASKAADRESMWRLYERIGGLGLVPDLRVFHHMFSGYRGRSDQAELSRLVVDMKAHGVQPDLEVFNIMLGVCGAVDVTLMDEVWESMMQSELTPDAFSHNKRLAAYCRSALNGHVHASKVLEVFQENPYSDAVTFATLADYFGKRGDLHQMQKIFQDMKEANMKMTIPIITSAMDAYSKSDQEAEMLAAFHSLATHGLQPNRYTYTTLLRHFAKKGDMASLLKYYGEAMARDDICTEDGDSGIHDMVLLGTVAVKDVETSMEVYDGMASGALPPPELYTLDILLKLCLEHKLENFALMLMRDMSKFGIEGDSRLYSTFALMMAKLGRHADAAKAFQQLVKPPFSLPVVEMMLQYWIHSATPPLDVDLTGRLGAFSEQVTSEGGVGLRNSQLPTKYEATLADLVDEIATSS